MDLNDLVKNPEQIKNLIQVLQALLPADQPTEPVEEKQEQKPSTSKKSKKTSPIKTRGGQRRGSSDNVVENRFERMAEFSMHKEDASIDRLLSKIPPVARSREEIEPMEVSCRICGKKELVNPSLIFESISRYKCNNCSTQAG